MGAFPAAIIVGFLNYVKFTGVASRAEYWYWYLFNILVSTVLAVAQFAVSPHDLPSPGTSSNLEGYNFTGAFIFSVLSFLFSLATLLPTLAVTVRRFHDAGYSGLSFFWGFVPLVGPFIVLYRLIQPTQHMARDAYGY